MKNMFARLLACLLMAAMLIPCAAVAELDVSFDVPSFSDIFTPATGYSLDVPDVPSVQWTHASGAISFQIPAEWTEAAPTDAGMLGRFIAADQLGSMNVIVAQTYGENMVPAFDEIKQLYTEQYMQLGCTIDSFELSTYGGRDAIVCQYVYQGVQQTQVMIQPSDYTAMATFTFAASAQKHINLVMNSVWMDE